MIAIIFKDISSYLLSFFKVASLILLIAILNVFIWILPSTSILEWGYADLSLLFDTLPYILMFFIPSITMDLIVSDFENGTSDLLYSKPINSRSVWIAHFIFGLIMVTLFMVLTTTSIYSIAGLKSETGIIDFGQIWGSYLGTLFVSVAFISISLFCSSMSSTQAGAFLMSVIVCYLAYEMPSYIAELPLFQGSIEHFTSYLSLNTHFDTLGKGLMELRSILYVLSIVTILAYLSIRNINRRLA